MPKKLTYAEVKKYIEIDSKSGCKLISKEYINSQEKLEVRCLCGASFEVRFNNFKSNNKRLCNKCAKEIEVSKHRLSIKYIEDYINYESQSGCTLLSKEYEGKKGQLKIRCKCGEVFYTNWECFKRSNKRQCNYCSGARKREKRCPVCEKGFLPDRRKQICCSKKCSMQYRFPPIYIECDFCKEEIRVKRYELERNLHHYCSQECRYKGMSIYNTGLNNPNYKNKSYLSECENCGKSILIRKYGQNTEHHYCSQKCKGQHQRITLIGKNNPRYTSVLCRCTYCHKELEKTPHYLETRTNLFCSQECKADWQSENMVGENNINYSPTITLEERENGRNFEGYLYWRRQVYRRDDYTCKCCGYDKGGKIVAHHLDSYNWAKDKRIDIDNGITLCKDCHNEFHHQYGLGDNTKEQFQEFLLSRK